MRTEGEPRPRRIVAAWSSPTLDLGPAKPLPRNIRDSSKPFIQVLNDRTSRTGGPLGTDDLSSLLWHSTLLRKRDAIGRFGLPWESRSAPSAGGLHPTRLLVLPVDHGREFGFYDPSQHSLLAFQATALNANRNSIGEILGAEEGTTLQLAADASKLDACYHNAESLMWRDAGALTAVICLVAAALDLEAVPVGRTGDNIVRATGLPRAFVGVGAVHVGRRHDQSE